MSPIERIKAHLEKRIEDAADCGYSAAERREELSTLDALIAERDDLNGALEIANRSADDQMHQKREAQVERHALLAERDALRKALEPFSDLLDGLDNEHDNAPIEIEVGIMERGVFTVGDLRRAHALLHGTAKQEPKLGPAFPPNLCGPGGMPPIGGVYHCDKCGMVHHFSSPCSTAKQEPFPSISRHADTGECIDSNVVPQEPKPRTCGECAHYSGEDGWCQRGFRYAGVNNANPCFLPRADAQKGQP